jgi:hypothetical protein
MLAWIIGGSISASNSPNHCGSKQTNRFFTHHDCVQAAHAGKDIGTGIAVAALIFLWVAGDVILGIIWLVTRSSKRSCPVCGNGVKKNIVVCPNCNFDFRSLQQPAPGMRQAQPQPQTPYPADAPAEASTSVTKPRQAVAVASRPPSAGPAVTNSDISQDDRLAELVAQVTPRVIRQWAIEQGIEVRPQGRIPKDVLLAYFAHNG